MAKTKTLRKLVDDVAVALQRLVRLKAGNHEGYVRCVTCNAFKHWKEVDGGHFISRTHQATKIMEENIHPQCKGCNLRSGKGDTLVTLAYRKYMTEFYGEAFVIEMEGMARHPVKHDRIELEQLLKEYRATAREIEGNL